jgi:hypothetical protein
MRKTCQVNAGAVAPSSTALPTRADAPAFTPEGSMDERNFHIPVSTRLPARVFDALDQHCVLHKRTKIAVITEALRAYLGLDEDDQPRR